MLRCCNACTTWPQVTLQLSAKIQWLSIPAIPWSAWMRRWPWPGWTPWISSHKLRFEKKMIPADLAMTGSLHRAATPVTLASLCSVCSTLSKTCQAPTSLSRIFVMSRRQAKYRECGFCGPGFHDPWPKSSRTSWNYPLFTSVFHPPCKEAGQHTAGLITPLVDTAPRHARTHAQCTRERLEGFPERCPGASHCPACIASETSPCFPPFMFCAWRSFQPYRKSAFGWDLDQTRSSIACRKGHAEVFQTSATRGVREWMPAVQRFRKESCYASALIQFMFNHWQIPEETLRLFLLMPRFCAIDSKPLPTRSNLYLDASCGHNVTNHEFSNGLPSPERSWGPKGS